MLELVPELRNPITLIALVISAILFWVRFVFCGLALPILALLYVSCWYPKDALWSHLDASDLPPPTVKSDTKQPIVKRRRKKTKAEFHENLTGIGSPSKGEGAQDGESEPLVGNLEPSAACGNPELDGEYRPPIRTKSDVVHLKSLDTDSDSEQEAGEAGPPLRNQGSCRNCWMPGKSICRRCNRIKYCSKECQRAHWHIHKQFCGKDDTALRHMWSMMWPECSERKGDMTRHRQFVEHVGGNFWCTDNGWRILHSLVNLTMVLRFFPEQKVLVDFMGLLQDALDLGADVNATTVTGDTPMHMAFKEGTKEALVVARYLLEFGAVDMKIRNKDGQRVEDLCWDEDCKNVIAENRFELDERLRLKCEEEAAKRAKPGSQVGEGHRKSNPNPQSKSHLAKPSRPPSRKDTCRECGMRGRLICRRCNKVKYCGQECQKKNWSIHKRFCGLGAKELNKLWNDLCSDCMARDGNTTDLRHFVEHVGGDFRVDPDGGWEILHNLTVLSHIMNKYSGEDVCEQFRLLVQDAIDFGADLNAQTKVGDTPLHLACFRENEEGYFMAKLLLEHPNVDVRIRNKAGRTARESCQDQKAFDLFADKILEAEKANERELLDKRKAAVENPESTELSSLSDDTEDERELSRPRLF